MERHPDADGGRAHYPSRSKLTMQEHIIEISPKGAVTVTVNGVKGASCKDATAILEKKLGIVTESTPTSEMYEQEQLQHGNLA